MTPLMNVTVHDVDPGRAYKRTRFLNKGRSLEITWRQGENYDSKEVE
jgi:hypothetical protein